jgi:hypothetical protein
VRAFGSDVVFTWCWCEQWELQCEGKDSGGTNVQTELCTIGSKLRY